MTATNISHFFSFNVGKFVINSFEIIVGFILWKANESSNNFPHFFK